MGLGNGTLLFILGVLAILPLNVMPKLICLGSFESDFGDSKFERISSVRTISVDDNYGISC